MAAETLDRVLRYEARVPSEPGSVGVVRRATAAAAEARGREAAERVSLVFTELVTNAIVHGRLGPQDRIDVEFVVSPEGLSGQVSDPGVGFALPPGGPRPQGESGFGLCIVHGLVRRWGVERQDGRTIVWFDL